MKLNNLKRIIIKLSGESLKSDDNSLFDFNKINKIASDVKWLIDNQYKVGIIVGGGNIIRGREFFANNKNQIAVSPVTTDYMGMLATVLNATILRSQFLAHNLKVKIKTAFHIEHIGEVHNSELSLNDYDDNQVLIFACGIGSPFFSTDTTAVLRGLELKAELIIFAKHGIDYVYDKDPNLYPEAKRLEHLTFRDAANLNLQVIDPSAIGLLINHEMTVVVLNFNNLLDFYKNPKKFKGTILTNKI